MLNREQQKSGRAIVIGGSMGGLLAARVLADHYGQVTILERDEFPPVGVNRRGVPQGRHTHGLLASGRNVLDQLFPGISNELTAAGAVEADIVRDARWFHEGGCLARFKSGLEGLLMTRPLLEGTVRRRTLALPNVTACQNMHVEGLMKSPDKRRVTGVRAAGAEFDADLVVDATGRGSHSPLWLEDMGYDRPEEERVEIGLAYTTRLFRRHRSQFDGDVAAIVPPTPEGKRGGVMLAQEGDRWTVTLIGHFGNVPPTDLEAFVRYAGTLPAPFIHEIVRNSEPVSEPTAMRFPASMRRRYEKLSRFPEGLLVFGDAISSFNPIYGQGMSVAALEAMELKSVLTQGKRDLATRFFARAGKIVDIPWSISVGNDLRMPETIGPRNAGVNLINWYMAKLHKAAHHDCVSTMAFFQVANLLAPPPSIMRPEIAMRVLKCNLFPGSAKNLPGEYKRFASARVH